MSQAGETPRCPDCGHHIKWGNYSEDSCSQGWRCSNIKPCGNQGVAGSYSWFCAGCSNHFCRECCSKADQTQCPDCLQNMKWECYREGRRSQVWRCNSFKTCENNGAVGTYRIFCARCSNKFCLKCFLEAYPFGFAQPVALDVQGFQPLMQQPFQQLHVNAALPTEKISVLRHQALHVGATQEEVDSALERPDICHSLLSLIGSKQAATLDRACASCRRPAAQGFNHCCPTCEPSQGTSHDARYEAVNAKADVEVEVHERTRGKAMQAEGHADVALRDKPEQGRIVATVPNCEDLKFLRRQAEFPKVRWKEIDGWAKKCNVQQAVPGHGASANTGMTQALLDKVEGVPDEKLPVLRRIASRGFELEAMLDFVCLLLDPDRALQEIHGLKESFEEHGMMTVDDIPSMKWFDPRTSTTFDVAYNAVVPLSKKARSAYAPIMMRGEKIFPKAILSHTWGNIFTHYVAACVADALDARHVFHIAARLQRYDWVRGLVKELRNKGTHSNTYWMCVVCINQHTVQCHLHGCNCGLPKCTDDKNPDCEIGHFQDMMRILQKENPDFYQVVGFDKNGTCLDRIWVIAEVAEVYKRGMPQKIKVHIDLFFSKQIRKKITTLRVEDSKATLESDRNMILSTIEDTSSFNKRVRAALLASERNAEVLLEQDFEIVIPAAVLVVMTTASLTLVQLRDFLYKKSLTTIGMFALCGFTIVAVKFAVGAYRSAHASIVQSEFDAVQQEELIERMHDEIVQYDGNFFVGKAKVVRRIRFLKEWPGIAIACSSPCMLCFPAICLIIFWTSGHSDLVLIFWVIQVWTWLAIVLSIIASATKDWWFGGKKRLRVVSIVAVLLCYGTALTIALTCHDGLVAAVLLCVGIGLAMASVKGKGVCRRICEKPTAGIRRDSLVETFYDEVSAGHLRFAPDVRERLRECLPDSTRSGCDLEA